MTDQTHMRRVFLWATGQDDNIGDVVLRRRILRTLSPLAECHVYVADASDGFVESLLVDAPRCIIYRDFATWCRRFTASAFGRVRTSLVFNPGEIKVSRWYALRYAALLPGQWLTAARGWRSVRVGVGIYGAEAAARSPWRHVLRASAAASRVNTWRSEEARAVVGRGEVVPDFGFDERLTPSPESTTVRDTIAVSLRGDREVPRDEWIAGLTLMAEREGLSPVMVVQVRRDATLARTIADTAGWGILDWPDDVSPLEQERRVRELYARSALVVGDRLHALVIGLTEGAIPSGATETNAAKIEAHFEAAGFPAMHVRTSDMTAEEVASTLQTFTARTHEFEDATRRAQVKLRAQDRDIEQIIIGAR